MLGLELVPHSSSSLELRQVLQLHVETRVILAHCGLGLALVYYPDVAPSLMVHPRVQGPGHLYLTPHGTGYSLQEDVLWATRPPREIALEELGLGVVLEEKQRHIEEPSEQAREASRQAAAYSECYLSVVRSY
jgi:hypothetical protein